MQCIECYVCWHCQYWYLWLLHNTVYRAMRCENSTLLCIQWPQIPMLTLLTQSISISNTFNATSTSAHNFLNIQQIFNLQKVLERDRGLFNQILYMLTLSIQVMTFYTIYNTFNAMHVNTDSELSKTLNGLKISQISRKLWAKMYWQCQHCWYSWKILILSFPKL